MPASTERRPRAILLATDLSARGDRALDRAAQLAKEWAARLVVVHVVEVADRGEDVAYGTVPDDPVRLVRRQLIRDVGEVAETATLVIETGQPAEGIIRTAEREGCDLIILGIARDELLGRYALGTTVDRLLRGTPLPLLIVTTRPRGAYAHIVVASDFSEPSRHALETAMRLFPDRRLTLFHAFDPPGSLIPDLSVDRRDVPAAAIGDAVRFIAATPRPDVTPEPDLFVEQGEPADLLRSHVREGETDLVVLGSHGRSAIREIFVGSVAKRILDRLPCDALVVREAVPAT
jgi:nucleotide-binding universal stress UspA family protein